ncbi:urea ABC transporter permease subunit UrtB [Asaia spathodeae]|uniref:Urea ABC transporter permease subunit UrtB n=1 Tax=Asaia spathodeae TaxID=657016 RepID=A0ABX2P6G0_9PROT|nr:urea ABC transporter permease subunit UrtB [Asaia spathodeae]GBR11938.1 urea short-chain amide or branched-chain amino acid transporter permease [Asaia spathodeae NBRC 105894]
MRKAFLALAFCTALACQPAHAQEAPARPPAAPSVAAPVQTPADAYTDMASTHFDAIIRGVERLGRSGEARALAALQALEAHKLLAGNDTIYIRTDTGLVDARTGQNAPADLTGLHPVRLNNRVRQTLASARAELLLAQGTQTERRDALAQIQAHPDAAMLPVLDKALADPSNKSLTGSLNAARAAILLSPGAPPVALSEQLAAVAAIKAQGGLPAKSLLSRAATLVPLAPQTREAAGKAVASIDFHLKLWGYGQDLFYGVSLSSVLLLSAMGLAITFGVMGVINMAHGELMMVGAYTTFMVERLVAAYIPALAPFSLILALPVAFVVSGGLGILIERSVIRFLYGRPLETLLASWGVSLILQQAIRSVFGPTNVAVTTPGWLGGSFALGGLEITTVRLAIFLFAIAVMAALTLVLKRTPLGLHMRAVTQNRRMAALMGIRTARVDALTFGLGSGIAGLAGVAVSQIDNVSPNLGQGYIIDSFLVVVFGGVGNLWGSLAAALALGIGGKGLEPLIGAVSGKILLLVLVILFIQRHPRGMFPMRGRGIES